MCSGRADAAPASASRRLRFSFGLGPTDHSGPRLKLRAPRRIKRNQVGSGLGQHLARQRAQRGQEVVLRFEVAAVERRHHAQSAVVQRPGGVNGPTTLDSRYVTEDVPFGLVPTIRLAALAGVPVPLHDSGLRVMSALYGRDFE
ncbi:MAG: hypothetical protein EOO24_59440, partial [Comamonadaceae bacterium]